MTDPHCTGKPRQCEPWWKREISSRLKSQSGFRASAARSGAVIRARNRRVGTKMVEATEEQPLADAVGVPLEV